MDGPGLNFQWNYREGNGSGVREIPSPLICTESGPNYAYDHGLGNCIFGGYVYRGSAIPEVIGKYIFGDNGSQLYCALEFDPVTKETLGVQTIGKGREGTIWNGISSFGIDSAGKMLLLQMGAGTGGGGRISRIKRAGMIAGDT